MKEGKAKKSRYFQVENVEPQNLEREYFPFRCVNCQESKHTIHHYVTVEKFKMYKSIKTKMLGESSKKESLQSFEYT